MGICVFMILYINIINNESFVLNSKNQKLAELSNKNKLLKLLDVLFKIKPKWKEISFCFENSISNLEKSLVSQNPYQLLISAINHNSQEELISSFLQDFKEFEEEIDIDYLALAITCWACKYNNRGILEDLLNLELNINAVDITGMSPLHYACKYGTSETVITLIKAGANINIEGLLDINNLKPIKPISFAIENINTKIIRILLDEGEDVNSRSHITGFTPLHCAASKGLLEMEYCIEKGADVNTQDNEGKTPLHLVTDEIESKTKLLLESGADVNVVDNLGKTPLHYASRRENYDNVKALIRAGADVNAKDYTGMEPLHCAARHSSSKNVQILTQAGANINSKDINGITPLHCAVRLTSKENIKTIIDLGADINAQDINGMTPLHFAVQYFNVDNAQILLHAGADITLKDNKNMTPLDIAISRKNHKIVKLLSLAPSFVVASN